jgi:hypothetical protein
VESRRTVPRALVVIIVGVLVAGIATFAALQMGLDERTAAVVAIANRIFWIALLALVLLGFGWEAALRLFMGFAWASPPEAPKAPLGGLPRDHVVDLRCPDCGKRADPDDVSPQFEALCRTCKLVFPAARPRGGKSVPASGLP